MYEQVEKSKVKNRSTRINSMAFKKADVVQGFGMEDSSQQRPIEKANQNSNPGNETMQLFSGNKVDYNTTLPNNLTKVIGGSTNNTIVTEGGVASSHVEGNSSYVLGLNRNNIAGGSPTNANVRSVSQAATRLFGKKYIAGHLLNNHLGGPGTDRKNITAFTSRSNSLHLHAIEKLVKKDVIKEGLTAEYSVRVIGRSNIVKDSNNKINGLADNLYCTYGLLAAGGNPASKADYIQQQTINIKLAPGQLGRAEQVNGVEGASLMETWCNGTPLDKPTIDSFANEINTIFENYDGVTRKNQIIAWVTNTIANVVDRDQIIANINNDPIMQ
ncbi:MAG: hypothetical protein ACJASQ_002149 [Crocinitomicaceae bacterium]|jgi:hypothetical protein